MEGFEVTSLIVEAARIDGASELRIWYENPYGVFLAGTFLAILPPALLFFYLQREFILGLTSGGVKE